MVTVVKGFSSLRNNQEQYDNQQLCDSRCGLKERFGSTYTDEPETSSKPNKFMATYSGNSKVTKCDEDKGVPVSDCLRGGNLEVDRNELGEPVIDTVNLSEQLFFDISDTFVDIRQLGRVQDKLVVIGDDGLADKVIHIFNKDGQLLHKIETDLLVVDMITTKGRFAFFGLGGGRYEEPTSLLMVDTETGESVSDSEYGTLIAHGANSSDDTLLFNVRHRGPPFGPWTSVYQVEPQTSPLGFEVKENTLEHLNDEIMDPYDDWRIRGVYPLSSSDLFFVAAFGFRPDGTVDFVPMTLDKEGRMHQGRRIPMENYDNFGPLFSFQEISETKFRIFGYFAFEVDLEEGTGKVPEELQINLQATREEIARRNPGTEPIDYRRHRVNNGFFFQGNIGESDTTVTALADTDGHLVWMKELPKGKYLHGIKNDGFWRMLGNEDEPGGFQFYIDAIQSVTVKSD